MTNNELTTPQRNGLLFLCRGNSSRSQMAEGFARFIGPSYIKYYSAGFAPTELSPYAVKAMREVGIDISEHRVKALDEIPLGEVATLITLYEEEEEGPALPGGVLRLDWPIPSPAATFGDDEDVLQAFRRARDQIRELVSRLF